ncbi:MAG: hypothetical protein V5A55_10855 [Halovenus sp.]
MAGGDSYRAVVVFVSLYLLFSLPPFLALNWEVVQIVYARQFPPDRSLLVAVVLGVVLLLGGIAVADSGIDRYNEFILAPNDPLSILVGSSFLWAAISWWFLPELVFVTDTPVSLNILLLLVLLSQLPMLLFLGFLTAVGRASSADTPW